MRYGADLVRRLGIELRPPVWQAHVIQWSILYALITSPLSNRTSQLEWGFSGVRSCVFVFSLVTKGQYKRYANLPFEVNNKILRKSPNVEGLLSITGFLALWTKPLTTSTQPLRLKELFHAVHLNVKEEKNWSNKTNFYKTFHFIFK